MLCLHLGFPSNVLHQISHLFPGQCYRVMEMMFDLWYPFAEELLKKDFLTTRVMLANAYYKIGKETIAAMLLIRDGMKNFNEKSQKRFFIMVARQLSSQITNGVDLYCYRTSETSIYHKQPM